jgi:hypothetical protein
MFPELNNPLTHAYVLGAKAKTHNEMMAAMKLAKQLELGKTPMLIAACQLAAEHILDGATNALRESE